MASLNMPHILVIGGTGFIGHHLVKFLKKKDWKVTSVSLSYPSRSRLIEDVHYLKLDLNDRTNLGKNLEGNFDYVVNLGGYINHLLFRDGGRIHIDNHFTMLQNLLEALKQKKIKRFVQIGSSDEYGHAPAPQHEKLREQPISPYSLAKVASTHFLQMLHLTENFPTVILRLFLTYGPGQDPDRFLPQLISGCLDDLKFPTSWGEQLRDFCYVDDTVKAIMQALSAKNIEGEIFNIGSGRPVSIRKMIQKVCTITSTGTPEYGIIPYRPGENMALYANVDKSEKYLNWESTTNLDTGLKKTIEWYSNEKNRITKS